MNSNNEKSEFDSMFQKINKINLTENESSESLNKVITQIKQERKRDWFGFRVNRTIAYLATVSVIIISFLFLSHTLDQYLNDNKGNLSSPVNFMNETEAIEFAQKASLNDIYEGDIVANFKKDWKESESEEIQEVWVIEVTYPVGNKTIFYIDAISGDPLSVAEIEASNSEEHNNDYEEPLSSDDYENKENEEVEKQSIYPKKFLKKVEPELLQNNEELTSRVEKIHDYVGIEYDESELIKMSTLSEYDELNSAVKQFVQDKLIEEVDKIEEIGESGVMVITKNSYVFKLLVEYNPEYEVWLVNSVGAL
ncbi:hypothetical protein [Oceanobacillus salinisoli]|uniref:hypothetical protein n=1 Tax=Oceanobacillus salinisoli TaxID=2678611 RepID=UPI0012E0FF0D|nr:hypothetical protein [Oceanobacillus salinisoli]